MPELVPNEIVKWEPYEKKFSAMITRIVDMNNNWLPL